MCPQSEPISDDGLRQEAAAVVRERTPSLVSDLAGELRSRYPDSLGDEEAQSAAGLIVTLLTSALENGDVSPRSGALHDLERLSHSALGTRNLFHSVDQACVIIADELALDADIGATSEPWLRVLTLVRLAAFDVLAAFTARLLDTPAHGAVRDPLTTLIAHPVFVLALQHETYRAVRRHGSFALILFDVDNLARINREHGYGVGDRVLERLGILAQRFFRTLDWVSRYDEDAIVALLPDTSLDQAALLATRFRETVQQRLILLDHTTDVRAVVTLSAAVVGAEHIEAELEPSVIMAEAEVALARAKMGRKNRTETVALLPTSVTLLAAAGMLNCSALEIRQLVRSGKLPAARRGRHYHVDRKDIEWLKAQRTTEGR